MDPALIQRILLDDAESYSKQPLNDDVFGEAIGGGLLNAEGDEWRWQRRLAAPLFRAEEMLYAVRGRTAHLHRRDFCHARRKGHPRNASHTRPFRAARRRSAGTICPHHASAQKWAHSQSNAALAIQVSIAAGSESPTDKA